MFLRRINGELILQESMGRPEPNMVELDDGFECGEVTKYFLDLHVKRRGRHISLRTSE